MENSHLYRVEEVTRGKAPPSATEGQWFRYVIANKHTRVVGRCCGTQDKVSRHVEGIVEKLNQRARLGYSPTAPRSNARKAKGGK